MYDIEDYDYHLPEELIAQVPESKRDNSRLLCIDREKKSFADQHFSDLPGLLRPGDLLVVNNTKVVPAKLFGRKETGGKIEILVLEHTNKDAPDPETRWCLLKSSKRPKTGSRLLFENGVSGSVQDLGKDGLTKISFSGNITIDSLIESSGLMPLPPYIKRENQNGSKSDIERYQTVYAKKKGAVAAPTAGLHFTEPLISELKKHDILLSGITLHVGHGTFRPVRTGDIREHNLGEEEYIITPDAAQEINQAKKDGRRIIAVGTTVVRTLETVADNKGFVKGGSGKTGLMITPGFRFKVISGMITNFHLPRTSLLFLVSALAGNHRIKKAYETAVHRKYRFYSYGDAMLIT